MSTTKSIIRSGGGAVYAGSAMLVMEISFDPTAAAAASGKVLPAGAVVLDVVCNGGATGGTNPTVDVGFSGTTAGFANELDADAKGSAAVAGTLGTSARAVLASDTDVWVGVGASAATGGTVIIWILYYREDPAGGVG